MTLRVDLYWAFRSPYSYLAIPRLVKLHREFDVDIHVRHVYPLVLRKTGEIAAKNASWVKYVVRDAPRVAESLRMPFRWPKPDPLVQDMMTLHIASDQPYIHRLTRLGQAATDAGRGLAFAFEVASLLWGGTRGWDQGEHLALAAARAGLELEALERRVAQDAETLEQSIQANHAGLEASGHWGVPTMVFDGEPFFGQDRVEILIWRLSQCGLSART